MVNWRHNHLQGRHKSQPLGLLDWNKDDTLDGQHGKNVV